MDQSSTCPEPEHLQAFGLGQVAATECQRIEQHLAHCDTCRTLLRSLTGPGVATQVVVRPAHPPTVSFHKPGQATGAAPPPEDSHDSELLAVPGSWSFLRPPEREGEVGRLGAYRVLRLLGQGGMGLVFLAEDLTLGRPVALKVIKPDLKEDPEAGERFLREARLMAAIKHPHVATIYQGGQEGGVVYLAMELLDGELVRDRIRRDPPPEGREIARIGREIASGLAAIHRQGLVHRDIKPTNIWLEGLQGHVKILDFGLARLVEDDRHLTQSGLIVGTPAFMSPEQARGEKLDGRSDLFSLGSVLYCLSTRTEPFRGPTPMARLTALAVDAPPPVRELNPAIPEALSDLVMNLLAKDPAHRPPTAEVVVDRLRAIEDAWTEPSPTRGQRSRSRKRAANRSGRAKEPEPQAGRWRLLGTVVLLGIAVLAVAGTLRLWLGRPPIDVSALDPLFDPPPGERTYLSDLPIADREEWPLGPLPGGGEPRFFDVISVQGRRSMHGIGMHPSPRRFASITYSLGRKYDRLRAGVSMNDTSPRCPSILLFTVRGDGRELWRWPLRDQADSQMCDLEVTDVEMLQLKVSCNGEIDGAHGIWVEPYLTRKP